MKKTIMKSFIFALIALSAVNINAVANDFNKKEIGASISNMRSYVTTYSSNTPAKRPGSFPRPTQRPRPTNPPRPVLPRPTNPPSPTTPSRPVTPSPTTPPRPVTPSPTTPPSPTNPPATSNQGKLESEVVILVNQERAKAGLKPLKLDPALSKVALTKSEDMLNNNYFSHQSPTYGSPFDMMKKFGIKYKTAGENIAKGQKTAADVMKAWMNSEGHRKNILNPTFTDIGVGYVSSGGKTYWTQMFISK